MNRERTTHRTASACDPIFGLLITTSTTNIDYCNALEVLPCTVYVSLELNVILDWECAVSYIEVLTRCVV